MVTADAKGVHAVRIDNWKYIENINPKGERMGTPRLFNLADDPAERKDLYKEKPHIAKGLAEELDRIRKADYTR